MSLPRNAPGRRVVALAWVLCCILALVPTPALADDTLTIGATASVAAGEPVLLRTAPGFDAAGVTTVAPGTQVTVIAGPSWAADGSSWYQVDAWGQSGYLPGYALAASGSPVVANDNTAAPPAADPAVAAPAAPTEPSLAPAGPYPVAPIGTATITGTNGDGAVCRAWAGFDATVLGVVPEGATVEMTGDPVGEWQPVNCNGMAGYIHAAFVGGGWGAPAAPTDPWAAPTPTDPGAAPAPTEPAPTWTDPSASGTDYVTGYGTITNTNGDGVRCRAAADYNAAIVTVLGEGESVGLRGAPIGEWQPVVCGGVNGFVHVSFVGAPGTSAPPPDPLTTPTDTTTDPNAFGAPPPAAAPASGSGQAIADFALGYVGYPYVYAGEGPYAFDCSGFTKFVILNVLGIDITHDMFVQVGMGTPVGMGELQPGDLVFFQNTFRFGLSHAGIYIGGGQFVHAENESTGVRVSDLNSDYYASRWYGATRIG